MALSKRLIYICALLSMLLFAVSIPVAAAPATNGNTNTQQTVTDENGDTRAATEKEAADLNKTYLNLQYYTGLKGHKVELLDESGKTVQDGRIDAMGTLSFNDLDPGEYTLVLHKKAPKVTTVHKEVTYPLQTIIEACVAVGAIAIFLTWRIVKAKTESKYEYLREFQHELNLDGPYPVDAPMHDPVDTKGEEKAKKKS